METLKTRGAAKKETSRDIEKLSQSAQSARAKIGSLTAVISTQAPSKNSKQMFTVVPGSTPTMFVTINGRQFKFEGVEVK